jgi:hypothetical protein
MDADPKRSSPFSYASDKGPSPRNSRWRDGADKPVELVEVERSCSF